MKARSSAECVESLAWDHESRRRSEICRYHAGLLNAGYPVVILEEACRKKQMGEGWLKTPAQVPKQAVSMSIRQIMRAKAIIWTVPDRRKVQAVTGCLTLLGRHRGAAAECRGYSNF